MAFGDVDNHGKNFQVQQQQQVALGENYQGEQLQQQPQMVGQHYHHLSTSVSFYCVYKFIYRQGGGVKMANCNPP